MHFVHEVINYLTSQPTSTWTTVGSYLAGSTLVASLLQIVKHKLNITEAKKLVTFLLGFFSFLAAFADFLLQANASNPLPTLGHTTAYLLAGAVVVHRYAVSPAYYKLGVQFKKFSGFLDEVSQYQADKKNVAAVATTQVNQELDVPGNLEQFQV